METPGDTGEVAKDILDLIFFQLTKRWELWKDDDRIAFHPSAPWRHSGEVNRNRSQVISDRPRGTDESDLAHQCFYDVIKLPIQSQEHINGKCVKSLSSHE